VRNDFIGCEGAEIVVRHHFKVSLDLLGKFGAKVLGDARLQLLAFDFRLLIERFLVGQVLRGGMIKLPDQRLLPVRPRVRARALAVRQRQQHERIEIRLVAHDPRELNGGFRVVEISLLRHVRERQMMVDEQDQGPALRRGKAETRRGPLRKKCARLRMGTRTDRAAGVVQEQREIKNKRVLEFLEEFAVGAELRIFRLHHLVELVDADQGVFVGGVAMEKIRAAPGR